MELSVSSFLQESWKRDASILKQEYLIQAMDFVVIHLDPQLVILTNFAGKEFRILMRILQVSILYSGQHSMLLLLLLKKHGPI